MVTAITLYLRGGRGPEAMPLLVVLVVLGLSLLPLGCAPGGDEGDPAAPAAPSARTEQQAVMNLLEFYREGRVPLACG